MARATYQLKSCPHCRGRAELILPTEQEQWSQVSCTGCHARGPEFPGADGPRRAVDGWNRRDPDPSPVELPVPVGQAITTLMHVVADTARQHERGQITMARTMNLRRDARDALEAEICTALRRRS